MAQALYLKLILVVWRGMKMIRGQNKENKVCFQSCFGGDLLFVFVFFLQLTLKRLDGAQRFGRVVLLGGFERDKCFNKTKAS